MLSAWGGLKRRSHGVLLGMALGSLGMIVLGLGNGPAVWVAGAFLSSFFIPFINGSNQAIWQAKVAPDVQGRVFASRRLIAQISALVAIPLAGPLADYVFEPAMVAGGGLERTFGWLVGAGPGAGMALVFAGAGVVGLLGGLAGYAFHAIRNVEDLLPDHDAVATAPVPVEAGVDSFARDREIATT